MPPKKKEEFSLDKMIAMIGGQLTATAKKPNNLMYQPHLKQLLFHASTKKGKQYIGGNRSGKTTGGINEDIWWLRGQHPYRAVPEPPVIGRITTVDFKNGAEKIIIPNLKQWVPPSLLINGSWEDSYDKSKHVLHCENGSELEIMSYDQELEKFAGVPRHFTHFDEEPPKDIFGECKARLVDYGGSWWMTMTPVEGMTWTFDEIYIPSADGSNPLVEIVEVSMFDNPHLSREAIDDLLEGLDEAEKEIRGKGTYIAIGGLVFKFYRADDHIIPAKVPPASWTHYISLDSGFNNPTAVEWHAVAPNGTVVTYDEIYVREHTVEMVSNLITEKERHYREQYGIVPFLKIADPAIRQRSVVTGLSIQIEYSQHGHNLALGQTRSVEAGLDKMNNYFRLNKWFITENCPNLQKELRKYRRDQFSTSKMREKNNKKETPVKKDDHAIDSCRYFFSYMPDLNIELESKKPRIDKAAIATLMEAGSTYNPAVPRNVDYNLGGYSQSFANPVVHDEYVGEY